MSEGGLSKSGSKPLVIKVQLKPTNNNLPLKQGIGFTCGFCRLIL
jgi:hypothetical protein